MKGQRVKGATNFHEFRMGGIAPKTLYRSCHPITDASIEDAKAIAKSASKARIAAALNLCDTKAHLAHIAIHAPWYHRLFEADCIIALDMHFDYTGSRSCAKFRRAIQFMLTHDGPYLIHCYAGVDRTGFVCAVLGALMGAKLREIISDYVDSYNDSTMTAREYKEYSAIIVAIFTEMNDGEKVSDENLQSVAEDFLKQKVKLTRKELAKLKEKLAIGGNE
jgi:hypothetical protein